MSNEVYANGRELSCKSGAGKSIASFPDVCFTPPQTPATPPGVPLPYPNTGMASDTTAGSKTVQISGKEVMLKDKSYFKQSTGDEAGCAPKKGVVTSTNRGKVYYTSWSMDVKIEGENAVRHLDMTTHNHNPGTPNTPPWPFTDQGAVSQDGDCDKESKAIKDAIDQGKCSSPTDTSPSCCAVPERQCVMVAKKDDKKLCCDGKTTGHHVLPKQEMCVKGSAGSPLPGNKAPAVTNAYDHLAAPTMCVEGHYHRSRDETQVSRPLKEHGRIGTAYTQGRAAWLEKNPGKPYTYEDASTVAAKAAQKGTNNVCSEKCIKNQLDHYHKDKVTEVRVSQQSEFDEVKPAATPTGTGPP